MVVLRSPIVLQKPRVGQRYQSLLHAVVSCSPRRLFFAFLGNLRLRVGHKGQLALDAKCRRPAGTGASWTMGIFYRRRGSHHRSARRSADPTGPPDARRQGCRLRRIHRPATGRPIWPRRRSLHEVALHARRSHPRLSNGRCARRAVSNRAESAGRLYQGDILGQSVSRTCAGGSGQGAGRNSKPVRLI